MTGERGAVSVYAASAAVVLTCAALVAVQIAGLIRLKHEVSAAADLAALAASRASVAGDDPCSAAREVARLNRARVVECQMDYDVATITTRGENPTWWGQRWAVERTARAIPDFYLEE